MHFRSLRLAPGVAALVLLAAPALASAQALHAWNFDDAVGTLLPGVANSITPAALFATDIPGVATNGSGALSIQYNNIATTAVSYAPVGPYAPATGIYTLTITVAGWDLPSGTTNLQTVYFDLRNAAATAASLVTELTFLASDAGVSVRYRDSGSANNNIFLTGLPTTRSTPFILTLTINRNTNTFAVSYTDGGVTTVAIPEKALSTGSAGRTISHFDLRTLGNFTGGSFTVDSVVLASVPVLTPLQTWRQSFFQTTEPQTEPVTGSSADAADFDSDGIPNLVEYATGTNPALPTLSPLALGRDAEGRLTLGFTTIADPALTYTVQGSVDLIDWTTVSSFTSATLPAGLQLVTDTAIPGDGPRRFLRLSVTR